MATWGEMFSDEIERQLPFLRSKPKPKTRIEEKMEFDKKLSETNIKRIKAEQKALRDALKEDGLL